MKTNIKINYMILEQILRVTGFYKNLVDEHEFLDVIFKQAKTGEIDSLFRDAEARETVFEKLTNLTGLPEEYWSGEARIKLGIECINEDLNYDDELIDIIDLNDDLPFINKEEDKDDDSEGNNDHKRPDGHAYHGRLYQELLKNPLHLDYDEVYCDVLDKEPSEEDDESEIEKAINNIESLYSLRGLLTVILLNMVDEIELIDKANVYEHKKWEPYITKLANPTEHGITYSPKFVEINKGLVQTIIINLFDLGIPFTFRDYFKKEFTIK